MAHKTVFRSALFGGYNKEDVQAYIHSMENEIETIKLLHQKEKSALQRQSEEQEKELEGIAELPRVRQELEQARQALRQREAELEELRAGQEDLEAARGRESEMDALRQEKEELRQETCVLKQENSDLRGELEELRARIAADDKKIRELPELEEGFFDRRTMAKVMEDVRRNAKTMQEEALRESEKILEEARRDAERQRKELSEKIDAEMEEKLIHVIAMKHKIDVCIREVEAMQKSLADICSHMDQVVESMPTRLDEFREEPAAQEAHADTDARVLRIMG